MIGKLTLVVNGKVAPGDFTPEDFDLGHVTGRGGHRRRSTHPENLAEQRHP